MALSDRSRESLLPSFLYAPAAAARSFAGASPRFPSSPAVAPASGGAPSFSIQAPREKIEMYSPAFYAACTAGGIASCGLTHMAVTPLDLVKCNMQIDPAKYKSITSGFGILAKEQGVRGFFRGWVPTLLGYSAQGACKFGFYEFFKKYYSDIAGPEYAQKYKTLIYLAGSASAEVIADVALCPFEAVKVRVQTQPGFARGLSDGLPKFVRSEGALGLYKGIVPLWGRQIPYTMMKFASFETIVELIYKHAVPVPKSECSKSFQLGISFAGGYIAGVFCAIVSHPADNLVSFLNNAKGATVGDAVNKLGLWGLFTRGLPLRIVMIGTLTGAQWGIYDAFKVMVGLPTTGGVTPAPAPTAEEAALKSSLPCSSRPRRDRIAMAAKSSSSSMEGRRRLRPEIPLITCPYCRGHTVRELVVKTDEHGNKGRIFYRCPGGKRGSGCQYLRFEEDYLVELKEKEEEEKRSKKNQSR